MPRRITIAGEERYEDDARRLSPAELAAHPALTGSYGPKALSHAFVVPPACAGLGAVAETPWFQANYPVGARFMLTHAMIPERVVMACTIASGNVQAAIYSVARTANNAFDMVRVANSGIIACPTPGAGGGGAGGNSIGIPFVSPTELPAGEYVIGFWCDNTTAAFAHVLQNTMLRSALTVGVNGPYVSGMPMGVTGAVYSGRTVSLALEGSIPLV